MRIHVYDTTLRDGSQGEGVSFSLQDKLNLTRKLDELGVDFIEGGYPLSNPKDAEYFQEVRGLRLHHARVVAFGMTRRKNARAEEDVGLKALHDAGTSIVTIVGKTWDLHVTEVLGASLEENLRMIGDSIHHLKSQGREVFYDAEHFFDGLRHNRDYALATLRTAREAGAAVIILCDTNGGSLPEQIRDGVRAVREVIHVPLGIHCHNDCELAVANTLAAVEAGCTQVQGTINGLGERCGNVDLVSVIANLALKYGGRGVEGGAWRVGSRDGGVRLELLTDVSRYVYETANLNSRSNQPFVGASAFAHKGGMHVHAVAKNGATYEHLDPALVGNHRRILLSELAGQSNVAVKTAKYGLAHDRQAMARILQRLCELENAGYEFEAAEASFDLLVKKCLGVYQPWFERLAYHVGVETDARGKSHTEATVKVRVRGTTQHTVCEGDGPVNALDGALRKALDPFYPQLREMHLVDYKVRVVNAREGTAARVRVIIESQDAGETWTTVGVDENVIEASWLALAESFEYKLFKDEETNRATAATTDQKLAH